MSSSDKKLDLILHKLDCMDKRLQNLENKLEGHIDEVMGIYNYHRQPLDFITNTFNSYIIPSSKEISNKKTEQLTHQQSKDSLESETFAKDR